MTCAEKEILKDPEVISKLRNIGAAPLYHGPEETKEYVLNEIKEFEKLFGLKQ